MGWIKRSVDSIKQTVALILSSLSEFLKFEFPNKIILITYVPFCVKIFGLMECFLFKKVSL